MPQMSPLWWELLNIMTTSMMILTSIMIYHNKLNNPKSNNKTYTKNKLPWKW
uniref:ATP synthase F0 subunit 8 n=1 Tax=Pyrrhopeplus posthumus TaxID=696249 RepID=A0A4Y1JVM7_9HEMI|nr:ATP synthase F0 subunit 8 [Pyrrhopeplus posthumus]APO08796.1 ATP synthase F0 subunit 8 [Pyrrhopeplus posthumus]